MTTTHATPGKPLGNDAVGVRKRRPGRPAQRTEAASREAQRLAAAILEVLAGVRTPTDAAVALGIGVPRYYLYEQRALTGLVAACESREKGPGHSLQRQVTALEKEIVRLKQDCARQQALVRAAQRTIGLTPPPAVKPGNSAAKTGDRVAGKSGRKAQRKRRPVVRALKAVAALRAAPVGDATPVADSSGSVRPEVVQQAAMERTPTAGPVLAIGSPVLSGLHGG